MIATDPAILASLVTLDRFDRRSRQIDTKDPERVYRAVNRRRDILTAGALPSIREHFRAERREVLATLRAEWPLVSMTAVAQTLSEQSAGLSRRLEAIQRAAAAVWGRRLLSEIGLRSQRDRLRAQRERITRREAEPWLRAALAQLELAGAQKVVGITDETRRKIQLLLIASTEAGEGLFALQKRIDTLYLEQIIPHRSEVIARTEIAAAQGAGSQSAMRDAAGTLGVEIRKKWLATLTDERTRKTHLEAHHRYQLEAIALDDLYLVGSSALRYPGDPDGRPEDVIQCRCTETYERVGAGIAA